MKLHFLSNKMKSQNQMVFYQLDGLFYMCKYICSPFSYM